MGTQLKALPPTALTQETGGQEALAGTLEIHGPILTHDKDLRAKACPASDLPWLCMVTLCQLSFLPDLAYRLDLETESQFLHHVIHECFPIPFMGLKCSTGLRAKPGNADSPIPFLSLS